MSGKAMLLIVGLLAATTFGKAAVEAQPVQGAPTSAGVGSDPAPSGGARRNLPLPSKKQLRRAEDAYLRGARQFTDRNFTKAEQSFRQAVLLNPANRDYALSALFARQMQTSAMVRAAAKATVQGNAAAAAALLAEGMKEDPGNPMIEQHLPSGPPKVESVTSRRLELVDSLEGPVQLEPSQVRQSFHLRTDAKEAIRQICNAFNVSVSFNSSVVADGPLQIDVDDVDFKGAMKIMSKAQKVFFIPIEPRAVLVASNTEEQRTALMTQVQATVYVPGFSADAILELANMVRTTFNLQQVAVSSHSAALVLRGGETSVRQAMNILAELKRTRPDVLLDVTLYELDQSQIHDIGFSPPMSASAIDVATTAQNLITSNQALLTESIASGALTLTGSSYAQELEEVEFLVAAGVSGSSVLTGLLGTLGSYSGVPLAGISVSSATLNLLLTSTGVEILDGIELRAGSAQATTFRIGSRYPILTSLSSATTATAATAALEAAGVSSAVATKYGGVSTTNVPQIQFEDLGITLKVTPRVLQDEQVRLALDLKIESIAGTGVDGIPVLNDHTLTSTITVLDGETTILAALVNKNELNAISGVPELSDLPGFQGTNRNTNGSSTEVLLTVKPHVIRTGP